MIEIETIVENIKTAWFHLCEGRFPEDLAQLKTSLLIGKNAFTIFFGIRIISKLRIK